MLPPGSRLKASGDFRTTIRRGVRVGRPTLVLHAGARPGADSVRVGLVVSKAVGNAVTRNRVKRRLRHLAAEHLVGQQLTSRPVSSEPAGVDVVLRALPGAASVGADLETDLAGAWAKALARLP